MNEIQQAIDDLEAAVLNWRDAIWQLGNPDMSPTEYTLLCMRSEDVVFARFVDLLTLVNGPHVHLCDLVRRYEANTKALQTLLDDSGPQVMFLQMKD